jgi:hypothetical protein
MASNSNAYPRTSAQINVNTNSETNFASRSFIGHGKGRGGGKSRVHSTEQGTIPCGWHKN